MSERERGEEYLCDTFSVVVLVISYLSTGRTREATLATKWELTERMWTLTISPATLRQYANVLITPTVLPGQSHRKLPFTMFWVEDACSAHAIILPEGEATLVYKDSLGILLQHCFLINTIV